MASSAEWATGAQYYALLCANGNSISGATTSTATTTSASRSSTARRRLEIVARQVEVVFTDDRLKSLKLLRKHMNHNAGAWLDADVVAKVHRVRVACSDQAEMIEAVRLYSPYLLQVSEDGKQIRRLPNANGYSVDEGEANTDATTSASAVSKMAAVASAAVSKVAHAIAAAAVGAVSAPAPPPPVEPCYVKVELRGNVDEHLSQLPWSLANPNQDRVSEVSRDRDGVVLKFKNKQDADVSIAAMLHGARDNWRSGLRCSFCTVNGGSPTVTASKRKQKKDKKEKKAALLAKANNFVVTDMTVSGGDEASDQEASIHESNNEQQQDKTGTNTETNTATKAKQQQQQQQQGHVQQHLVGIVTSLVEERTVGNGIVLSGFVKLEQDVTQTSGDGGVSKKAGNAWSRKKRRAETFEIRIPASSKIDEDEDEGSNEDTNVNRGPLKVGDRVKFNASKNDTSVIIEHVTRLPRIERPKAASTWTKNRARVSIKSINTQMEKRRNSTAGTGGSTAGSASAQSVGASTPSGVASSSSPIRTPVLIGTAGGDGNVGGGATVFVSAVGPDRSGDVGFTLEGWRNARQGRVR